MRTRILFCIFTLMGSLSSAQDHANYFFQASKSLPKYLQFCLADSACQLEPQEKDLLHKILQNVSAEHDPQVVSESEKPGFFAESGSHRIAMTGSSVGDLIYINKDEAANITYFDAVAILTHELGHHYGIKDTEDRVLDILGAKMKSYLIQRSESVTFSDFHQPQIGIIIINSADKSVNNQLGSDLIVYDDKSVYDLTKDFLETMPCELGFKRKGSLIFSQLSVKGMTDWLPLSKSHSAVIEFSLKENCTSPKKDLILFLNARMAIELAPKSGAASPNWWQNFSGETTDHHHTIIAQTGVVENTNMFGDRAGLPLDVVQISSFQTQIKNGDTWTLQAKVNAPLNLPIESCSGFISSNDFVNTPGKPRYNFNFDECKLQKLSENTYSMQLKQHFPESTPSRTYFVESLILKVAGQNLEFRGYPDRLKPSDVSVDLHSSNEPKPIEIKGALIFFRDSTGHNNIVEPNLQYQAGGDTKIPLDSIFGLTFYINSATPFNPVSSIYGDYDWLMGTEHRFDDFENHVETSDNQQWYFPWSGSTVVQLSPDSTYYVFQLALRPLTHTPTGPTNQMNSVNYYALWLINDALQESYTELDFTITPY